MTATTVQRAMDTDVLIVGAGPAGLMLAGELCLVGVRPLVLERQPQVQEIPKAGGLGGQILRTAALPGPAGAARGRRQRPPPGAAVPVRRRAPGLHAVGRSADGGGWRSRSRSSSGCSANAPASSARSVRRGHEVVGVRQDDATVTVDVHGPDGPYLLTARYLVGVRRPAQPGP